MSKRATTAVSNVGVQPPIYDNDLAKGWPANHAERRSVASLVPYARNARTHSDAQVAQIAASIREWGWTVPVLIDDAGGLIAGHGRVLAARMLGIEEIPVIIATGWSEAKRRAYMLADNKLALNAGWDEAMIAIAADRNVILQTTGPADAHLPLPRSGDYARTLQALQHARADRGDSFNDLAVDAQLTLLAHPNDVKCPRRRPVRSRIITTWLLPDAQ